MPAMIFINVDLPAPFSPISAWTWPRFKRNDTSSRASTPGKALRTLVTSSRYSAPGTAPLCRMISAVDGLMVAMALRPQFSLEFLCGPSQGGVRYLTQNASKGRRRAWVARLRRSAWASGREGVGRSVLLHELIHVSRGHEQEGDVDLLLDRFAGSERQSGVDRTLALAGSVLEDGDLEVACLH